jgi:hypothetical protein
MAYFEPASSRIRPAPVGRPVCDPSPTAYIASMVVVVDEAKAAASKDRLEHRDFLNIAIAPFSKPIHHRSDEPETQVLPSVAIYMKRPALYLSRKNR